MNKSQLIDAISEKGGLKKKDAEAALNAMTAAVIEQIAAGDRVQIVGFGTFELKVRNSRLGRNPKTGEKISVPESKNMVFSASKALKEQFN